MGLTKSNISVIDKTSVSIALTNDTVNGGLVNYVNNFNHYYSSPMTIQEIATIGSTAIRSGLIFDTSGNLYWAVCNGGTDTLHNGYTCYIYKITPNGTITTFASQVANCGCQSSLIFDSSGNLYWSLIYHIQNSSWTDTSYIYKITPAGTKTTFASATTIGGHGGNMVFDSSGNLYWPISHVSDGTSYNQTSYVYKITPAGTKTTFASIATTGSRGCSLAIDTSNNIYWAFTNYTDGTTYNLTHYVYKITPVGTKTIFASQLMLTGYTTDLVFDTLGNLYWTLGCTTVANVLYKITPVGTKNLLASHYVYDTRGSSIIIDGNDNLYWALSNYQTIGNSLANTNSLLLNIKSSGEHSILASAITNGANGSSLIFDTNKNLYWSIANYFNGTTYNLNTSLMVLTKQAKT